MSIPHEKTVSLSYGRSSLSLRLPEGHPVQILEPRAITPKYESAYASTHGPEHTPERKPAHAPAQILRDALDFPIGSPALRTLTETAQRILIITNDHTRPMPSRLTIPAILGSFHKPPDDYEITILVATGLHRPMTAEEMREQFGEEICDRYRIVNHDARDRASLAEFGKLSTGNALLLNRLVAESDLVIAEGFIEPHFFAGFSGGRKSILPGVAGESTILANHKPEHIASPFARQAILAGNPIHDECAEAARAAGLRFILNVALDKEKRIIAAFAGDPQEAHREGCLFVESAMTAAAKPADIVVTSNNGYPLDRNLYQVVKGVDTAAKAAKDDGIIIVAARCEDGVGHEHFQNLILSCATVGELSEQMSVSPARTDQWQVQVLARVLSKHRVILVSEGIPPALAASLFFTPAQTLDEAMDIALVDKGPGASICVLPEGPVIIPSGS